MNTYEITLTNAPADLKWYGDCARLKTDRVVTERAGSLLQAVAAVEQATGLTAVEARTVNPLPTATEAGVRRALDEEFGDEPVITLPDEFDRDVERLVMYLSDLGLVPGLTCDINADWEMVLSVIDPVTHVARTRYLDLLELFNDTDIGEDGRLRQGAVGRDLDAAVAMRAIHIVRDWL